MKRILLAALLAALFLSGCKNGGRTEQGVTATVTARPEAVSPTPGQETKPETTKDPDAEPETMPPGNDTQTGIILPGFEIPSVSYSVWKDGKKTAEIVNPYAPSITNSGVLYAIHTEKGPNVRDAEYHLLNPDTGDDRLIGTVIDESYETAYNRVELNGRIYTLIVKREPEDGESQPLILLEIDPQKGITEHKVCEDGFPYAMLAKADDCLMIGNHDINEENTDSVWLYNPTDESMKKVICYPDGDRPLLQLCHVENETLVLCIREKGGKKSIILERYDSEFRKTEERDITGIYEKAFDETYAPEDRINELSLPVSGFFVTKEGLMYYENFSCTHFLADLVSGEVLRSAECFTAVKGSNGTLYYDLMKGFRPGTEIPNRTYLLEGKELKVSESNEENPLYYFFSMSQAENGTTMTEFEYNDPENQISDLPPMLVIR